MEALSAVYNPRITCFKESRLWYISGVGLPKPLTLESISILWAKLYCIRNLRPLGLQLGGAFSVRQQRQESTAHKASCFKRKRLSMQVVQFLLIWGTLERWLCGDMELLGDVFIPTMVTSTPKFWTLLQPHDSQML